MAILLFGSLVMLLLFDVPVGLALAASALFTMGIYAPELLAVAPIKMYNVLTNFILLSVPLFILAGNLAITGGVAETLARGLFRATRPFRGGLIASIVPMGVFFNGITGSTAADVAVMGTVLAPTLSQGGAPRQLVNGTIVSAAATGVLVPPALGLIIYAATAQVAAPTLYVAAFLPAMASAFLMFVIALWRSRDLRVNVADERIRRIEIWRVAWALPMPLILLVGIYTGVWTISEVGAAAAVYALLVTVLIYRHRDRRELLVGMRRALVTTTALFMVIIGATLFSFVIALSGVASQLVVVVTESHIPVWLVLLLLNAILLVLGSAMEGLGVLLVMVPIALPVFQRLGVSPIQLGIIVIANIELGLLLPPFGINLLTLSSLVKDSPVSIFRGALPYIAVVLANVLVVTFWPPATLWLPTIVDSFTKAHGGT